MVYNKVIIVIIIVIIIIIIIIIIIKLSTKVQITWQRMSIGYLEPLVVYMLRFTLIFGLNFLKPVYFFQTSSIIELGCRESAVVRALASNQCGSRSISRLGVICGLRKANISLDLRNC